MRCRFVNYRYVVDGTLIKAVLYLAMKCCVIGEGISGRAIKPCIKYVEFFRVNGSLAGLKIVAGYELQAKIAVYIAFVDAFQQRFLTERSSRRQINTTIGNWGNRRCKVDTWRFLTGNSDICCPCFNSFKRVRIDHAGTVTRNFDLLLWSSCTLVPFRV